MEALLDKSIWKRVEIDILTLMTLMCDARVIDCTSLYGRISVSQNINFYKFDI